jgi:hypothetical protein
MLNEFETEMMADTGAMSEMAITELSEGDLEQVSGGTGLDLGDLSGLFQNSGSFFSQENLSMGQATFAGPGGSGTLSTLDYQKIDSGAFQNIGFAF